MLILGILNVLFSYISNRPIEECEKRIFTGILASAITYDFLSFIFYGKKDKE